MINWCKTAALHYKRFTLLFGVFSLLVSKRDVSIDEAWPGCIIVLKCGAILLSKINCVTRKFAVLVNNFANHI